MTNYHKYLKDWTSERGITSFLGSDKPAFQQDWKEEKKGLRFGEIVEPVVAAPVVEKPIESEASLGRLRLLYRKISMAYETIKYVRRLLKNPRTNKIYGSPVREETNNRFKSSESNYYNIMKEISDALGWDKKERDSNKYDVDVELSDYNARQYGLRKDEQGYKYDAVDAALKLADDFRQIKKYRDDLKIKK